MRIFGKEPLVWIGIIVSLILAIVTNLNGQGLISDLLAGQVTDAVKAVQQVFVMFAPLITAILARPGTTSFAFPSVAEGTSVEVITPPDQPNRTTVV